MRYSFLSLRMDGEAKEVVLGVAEINARTLAARKFTRTYNRFNEQINDKQDIDLINNKYELLQRLWEDLQSKHDTYLITAYPDDEPGTGNEAEDKWIETYEERFEIATKARYDYLKNKEVKKDQEMKNSAADQKAIAIQSVLMERESLHLIFKQEQAEIKADIGRDAKGILKSQISSNLKNLKTHLDKCREAHLRYLSFSPADINPGEENQWIEEINEGYEKCREEVFKYLKLVSELEEKEKHRVVTKLENIKMPTFTGNIRDYAKFKADFETQVAKDIDPDKLCYVLRSCLRDEAKTLVENIDGMREIWNRLDERFGNPLVDTIMADIKAVGEISDGDEQKCIDFVNVIERGYTDLKRLNLEREISNSITVSMLEGKLPPSLRREWSKLVNCRDTKVDPFNKFPSFMDFLKEQRKILEYEAATLRSKPEGDERSDEILYTGGRAPSSGRRKVCLIHNVPGHLTSECRDFNGKSPPERLALVNSARACFSCLVPGHRSFECRFKTPCETNGCTSNHHPLLHASFGPTSVDGEVSAVSSPQNLDGEGKVLLPLMNIKSTAGKLSSL